MNEPHYIQALHAACIAKGAKRAAWEFGIPMWTVYSRLRREGISLRASRRGINEQTTRRTA